MDERATSALAYAAAIRDKRVGAEELLDVHLERIRARDPRLVAFVQRLDERARRHARRIDARHAAWPDPLPRFWGVPFAIKDNDPMRFTFTRVGSRAMKWLWAPFDSPSVKLLRAAGFVITGKTTTSELALMPVVEPDIHPPTRNPWNVEHSAGGSSGGSGAAVASGMLPIAHAADGGGSIRIPAAFCHLFGFKASRGLTADFYGAFDVVGLSVGGVLTTNVDDSVAAMDALCGRPFEPGADSLATRSSESIPPLKIRVGVTSTLTEVDPTIATAVEQFGKTLEGLGHEVRPGEALEGSVEDFLPVFGRLAANVPILRERALQPVTRWLREIGRKVDKAEARRLNDALTARVDAWFGDADLWILPSVARGAPKVGELAHLDAEPCFRAAARLGAFTAPFNVSGQPAASIPAGLTADGLPFGVQIVGRRGADALVLAVARALEQTEVWSRESVAPDGRSLQ